MTTLCNSLSQNEDILYLIFQELALIEENLLPDLLLVNKHWNLLLRSFLKTFSYMKYSSERWLRFFADDMESLDLTGWRTISRATLQRFTKLTSLCLNESSISEEAIQDLTQIKTLMLNGCSGITRKGIESMTCLTSLQVGYNNLITTNDLLLFTNLTSLSLPYYNNIDDETLSKLTLLKELNLYENPAITKEGIYRLTNLTSLEVSYFPEKFFWDTHEAIPNNQVFKLLTNLTKLDISEGMLLI